MMREMRFFRQTATQNLVLVPAKDTSRITVPVAAGTRASAAIRIGPFTLIGSWPLNTVGSFQLHANIIIWRL
jgi:hypothetical protein